MGRRLSFYGSALARVHDEGFDFIARGAAPAIVELLRAGGVERGLIVELGCGSGIAARVFTDRGYAVFGIAVSEAMVALARERAPAGRFAAGSLHQVDLPRDAVAVVAMGEIFNYAGIDDRLLARVRGALRPGGAFVFDCAAPGRESLEPRRAWHEGDDWVLCMQAQEHAGSQRLTRDIALFTAGAGDGTWTRTDERHELTLYEPGELLARLTAAGFEDTRALPEGYGPCVPLPFGLAVIAARSPAT